ncbi:prostaglandin reductase 1-like [Schistocerca serialis cubense]|uniref:prostaglandin reductase 1-like n=1 Tax=Schistocerca serialis cubense TaxID=2023355 RepID=UPI00214F306C|nr:prostaglandin reductase 1-like [Schistocerca serialis cubense]
MSKARKFVIARLFKGEPKVDDFSIEKEELPSLKNGQILCEAEYISVDPYQRAYTQWHKVGATMIGSQVARIVESRSPEYPVGRHVVASLGWRDQTVISVAPTDDDTLPPVLVPDLGDLPRSLALGVLGVTGATAYFGLLDICDPKPGEVVVVSGAAGAVGSIVGQIARIKGCKVIGIAGSDVKVSRIVESRSPDYPVGRHVVGYWDWCDRTVVNPTAKAGEILPPMLVQNYGDLPLSLSLGVLGMPGATAYFGLLDICDPKPGETVVVSGAAGAVGSIVGQIARIKGCKVIGITGSDVKVKWLKEELGFDHAINYKTVNVEKALKEAVPDGADVYFDNVGGEQSSAVIANMKHRGRISVCGCISSYNESKVPLAPVIQMYMVGKELKMEGFFVGRWLDSWDQAFKEMAQWIKEGKLKYKETVTEGFQNTPKAFIGMLRGENLGKAIVKV